MSAPALPPPSPASPSPKRLYLIRHGQTTFNVAGRLQGRSQESRLTPIGFLGARLAGRHLAHLKVRPDAIYSSQLNRAKQSVKEICSVLGPDFAPTELALLNERDVGRMEGLTKAQVNATMHQEPAVAALQAKKASLDQAEYERLYGELTGVETFASLRGRGQAFLDQVAASSHHVVVAVSHGRFLSTLFSLLDPKLSPHDDMANCTITTVDFHADTQRWRIEEQYDGNRLFNQQMLVYNRALQYPPDHWALHRSSEDVFVASLQARGLTFLVFLHPLDARGYRSIVRLWTSNADTASLLNRPSTPTEEAGLFEAAGTVSRAWRFIGLIPQTLVLGNNSQTMGPDGSSTLADDSRPVLLGTPHEPSFLHAHIIARGNPAHCYVPGVPLRGPPPGVLFGVRDQQDDHQTVWAADEKVQVRDMLRDLLHTTLAMAGSIVSESPASALPPTDLTRYGVEKNPGPVGNCEKCGDEYKFEGDLTADAKRHCDECGSARSELQPEASSAKDFRYLKKFCVETMQGMAKQTSLFTKVQVSLLHRVDQAEALKLADCISERRCTKFGRPSTSASSSTQLHGCQSAAPSPCCDLLA